MKKIYGFIMVVAVLMVVMVPAETLATPKAEDGVIAYRYSSDDEVVEDTYRLDANEKTDAIEISGGNFRIKISSSDCRFKTIFPNGKEVIGCVDTKKKMASVKFQLQALDADQKIEMKIDFR